MQRLRLSWRCGRIHAGLRPQGGAATPHSALRRLPLFIPIAGRAVLRPPDGLRRHGCGAPHRRKVTVGGVAQTLGIISNKPWGSFRRCPCRPRQMLL